MSRDYRCKNHVVLSMKEEFDIFEQYKNSSDEKIKESLRNKIIEHNMKFAMGCALVYMKRWKQVDPNDLKGYAVMGLIEAFDNFDHTRGVKFSSYASWWVKCTINRNVESNESLIRYPSNKHRELYVHYVEQENSEDIDRDNLNDEFDVISSNIFGGVSIEQPLEGTDLKLGDTISDNTNIESDFIASETVRNALKSLSPLQKKIIEGIFGFDDGEKKTVRELADTLNMSHENIRNIKNKALAILAKRNLKGEL